MLRIASWFARTASAVVLVCLLSLVAQPGGVSAQGAGIIAVGYGAGGYLYQQVAPGGGAGFEQPGYDASSWATGAAAFGSPGVGPCGVNHNGSIKTTWAVNTDLLVRKAVSLNPGASNVVITGTVDNNATVSFNGVNLGTFFSGNCIQGAIFARVPDSLLAADGNNLLAIRGQDFGVASYLDVQVTYDDGPAYAVCPLHDATKAHKAGSTAPLKLQLCDGAGANLSDPSIVVNASGLYQADPTAATSLVPDAGNANPDQDFRYAADLGGYIYNLKTTGLGSGTWVVTFTVNGEADPSYFVTFDVR
ncbi:MAG: hypothetical protein AVDCRST_MAG73-2011 [uncultured Thermomicrobiales bacterium]|uniref:Uncharacterized protein n=1 Tax=uncultured Thermomicrobiales bacterium TaxID=1645740 RepID=A0A6J4U6C8_9BACT|nr:MAG: hypothetical protein AVDCRST_MAG73-2011 [uncultured Thermomicrobiales bacterium]